MEVTDLPGRYIQVSRRVLPILLHQLSTVGGGVVLLVGVVWWWDG